MARMKTRVRSSRFKCSSGLNPDASQTARTTGRVTQRITVRAKAFEVQPPHLRYQLKANTIATTQETKRVTANQSMGRCMGRGGRSGRKYRQTSPSATSATGTKAQYIQRHDSQTSSSA